MDTLIFTAISNKNEFDARNSKSFPNFWKNYFKGRLHFFVFLIVKFLIYHHQE